MENRMSTRQRQLPDYYTLNGGSDEEAAPADMLPDNEAGEGKSVFKIPNQEQATNFFFNLVSFENHVDSEIMLEESVSQTLPESTITLPNIPITCCEKRKRPAPTTEWIWGYFDVTTVSHPWKTCYGKAESIDKDIQCQKCSWRTTDSQRQTSTTNMKRHLQSHAILPPHENQQQPSIVSLVTTKKSLSHNELLGNNILQWIVKDKQVFSVIESTPFQQIFKDIPGISLPFTL